MLTLLVATFAVISVLYWYLLFYKKIQSTPVAVVLSVMLAISIVSFFFTPVKRYPEAISKNSNSSYTTNKFGVSTYSFRDLDDSTIRSRIITNSWDSATVATRMSRFGTVFNAQDVIFGYTLIWDIQPIDSLQYDSLKNAGIRELH